MTKGERYRAPKPGLIAGRQPQTAYERFLQKLAKQHPNLMARSLAEPGQDEPALRLLPRKKNRSR